MRTTVRPSHLLALIAVTAVWLAAAPPARADSVTLAVLTTSGQSDPVGYVSRIFSVSGTSSTPKRVYVKSRASGGAPCAPTPSQDTGTYLMVSFDVNGNF